jgi:SAM-dependent MidA family methyltransferase
MSSLPTPSPEALSISQQLANLIQQKIAQAGGWIPFSEFMHMALYTPSLGYYNGGATKFGHAGDFVTAPEISPLFAKTLARQAAQVLLETKGNILELGAGTGKLAADMLLELQQLNALPSQYFILEVSDHLRQVQRETLQKKLPDDLFKRVVWLQDLPSNFVGLIFANEVLDALPVHLLVKKNDAWLERGVAFTEKNSAEFIWQDAPLAEPYLAENLIKYLDKNWQNNLPDGYLTEVSGPAPGLLQLITYSLKQGVILLIDYGFAATEYYHPQRNAGTLMCHYQHYALTNPLINVGLQDITAHVNFSQIAHIAMPCEPTSMRLAGYVNQAQFLINCGILDILSETSPTDMAAYAPLAAAAQKLLSPAEMGDLFKVIALSKNFEAPLIGFKDGDKSHVL